MLNVFQKKIASYAITAFSIFVLGAFVVLMFKLLGEFLNEFSYVLFPIAMAIILSYALEPVVLWISHKMNLRKSVACVICFTVIAIFTVLLLALGIPYVVRQLTEMISSFPEFIERVGNYLAEHSPNAKEVIDAKIEAFRQNLATSKNNDNAKVISNIVSTAKFATYEISSISSFVAALAVVPVYLYYILISDFDFFNWLDTRISFFSEGTRANIVFFLRRFSEIMQSFFRGQLLIASIMGVMLGIALKIAGVKFGFILGFSAGMLNIIPYFGTIIGLGTILPVAFFQADGGLVLSAVALTIFIVVQCIEGYYLTPKIMGDKTGLHPTVMMFSVFFWGTALNGILGMILAIPFSAFVVAAYPKFHEWISDFLERHKSEKTR